MGGFHSVCAAVRICAISVALQQCLVAAGGFDGVIQYPGAGEYCAYYYQGYSFDIYDYSPSSNCRPCFDSTESMCPWNCGAGCSGVDNGYDYSYNLYKSYFTCVEGCMFSDLCFPMEGGYFTGSAVNVGDPTSCPFDCFPGFIKVDTSCMPYIACPAGQYMLDGQCYQCRICDNGYWLEGCDGTNVGECRECTN
jgi:hypothetical protein